MASHEIIGVSGLHGNIYKGLASSCNQGQAGSIEGLKRNGWQKNDHLPRGMFMQEVSSNQNNHRSGMIDSSLIINVHLSIEGDIGTIKKNKF